ncbi:MAG: hypothetical protein QJR08_00605 [Bacillota bacterium]|nr:hypothetical protein [Bacillota bacterium]
MAVGSSSKSKLAKHALGGQAGAAPVIAPAGPAPEDQPSAHVVVRQRPDGTWEVVTEHAG